MRRPMWTRAQVSDRHSGERPGKVTVTRGCDYSGPLTIQPLFPSHQLIEFAPAVRTFSVLTVLRAYRIAWVSGGNSRHRDQNTVCNTGINADTGSDKRPALREGPGKVTVTRGHDLPPPSGLLYPPCFLADVLTVLRAHRIAWVSGGNSRHRQGRHQLNAV
jgi:hypothetical protein